MFALQAAEEGEKANTFLHVIILIKWYTECVKNMNRKGLSFYSGEQDLLVKLDMCKLTFMSMLKADEVTSCLKLCTPFQHVALLLINFSIA